MGDSESFWQSALLSRGRFLGLGALAVIGAACGGGKSETGGGTSTPAASTGGAAAPPPSGLEQELRIYNWAQYIDPASEKAYAKELGVKVTETNYGSNEELFTKLQTTKGQSVYDIIVPDADHVRIEKDLGLLLELDHEQIPNLANLAPHWTQLPYDIGNVYSVVKDIGITCMAYRTDLIKQDLKSWKDFFDYLPSTPAGVRVNVIESPSEIIGVALNSLGHSMSTEDDAQLEEARKLLLAVRPFIDTINVLDIDDMSSGKIHMAITYSGDGLRAQAARAKQNDFTVVAPEGLSEIWIDNWSISAFAPDPKAAHAWINFILEPKNNAREMLYHNYEVGTPDSFPLVGDLATNPLIVFGDRILNDYEILKTTPSGLEKRIKIWDEFKAA